MQFRIDNVVASVDEYDMVMLDAKFTIGKLNETSFLGYFNNIIPALTEAMFNQIKKGDEESARNTLEEINKLYFWKALGATMGSVEIRDGVLHGLSNYVEIDTSLKNKINEGVETSE